MIVESYTAIFGPGRPIVPFLGSTSLAAFQDLDKTWRKKSRKADKDLVEPQRCAEQVDTSRAVGLEGVDFGR